MAQPAAARKDCEIRRRPWRYRTHSRRRVEAADRGRAREHDQRHSEADRAHAEATDDARTDDGANKYVSYTDRRQLERDLVRPGGRGEDERGDAAEQQSATISE